MLNLPKCFIRNEDDKDDSRAAVCVLPKTLRFEGTTVDEVFQMCHGDPLHADGAPKCHGANFFPGSRPSFQMSMSTGMDLF